MQQWLVFYDSETSHYAREERTHQLYIFRAGVHKMLDKIANREYPEPTAVWSDSALFFYTFATGMFKILEHLQVND